MATKIVKVADVNILVDVQDLPLDVLNIYFVGGDENSVHATLRLDRAGSERFMPDDKSNRTLMHSSSDNLEYVVLESMDIVRQIGFLASLFSPQYRLCHGAGVMIDGKGVLLLGRSGSGKSTLVNHLLYEGLNHSADLVDDDLVFVNSSGFRSMMRRLTIGRFVRPEGRENSTYFYEDGADGSTMWPLDYVFVLNRGKPSELCTPLQKDSPFLTPALLLGDHFSELFYHIYRKPAFDVPIYEIGTREFPETTLKTIREAFTGKYG